MQDSIAKADLRDETKSMCPVHLDRIARAFPDMPIVGAHFGAGAWYEEAAAVTRWNANVYFDMSIGQFHFERKGIPEGREARAIKPRIQELRDAGCLDLTRILFGTDAVVGNPNPLLAWYLRTLEFELAGLGASDEEKQAVCWRTAAKLLKLGE